MRPGANGPSLIGIMALPGARVKRVKPPRIGGEIWRGRPSMGQIGRRAEFDCQFVHARSNGFDSLEFRELAARIPWTRRVPGVFVPASGCLIPQTADAEPRLAR